MERPLKHITLKNLVIQGERQIGFLYRQDQQVDVLLRSLHALWSNEYNMPYIQYTTENLNTIYSIFKGTAWINGNVFYCDKPIKNNDALSVDYFRNRKVKEGYRACPESFYAKLELKHYSLNTAKTYISCFEAFINHYKDKDLNNINEIDIREYLRILSRQQLSDAYILQSINSIKFYYEIVLGVPNRFYSIERPFRARTLPTVLSKEEVAKMLGATKNIKHKCIIELLYSAGLRRSELLNIRLENIDSSRMQIKVVQ